MGHESRSASEPAASRAPMRTSSPVLIGRDQELRTLVECAERPPSTIFVAGEAGIGKTRIVHEVIERPRLSGKRILLAHCQAMREPFPYGAILDALREVGASLPHTRELSPVAGALRAHLPELTNLLPPPPERLDDAHAERHRLFRAVRELLDALGHTVLIVEDLHCADEGSRDLLRFLMSDMPRDLTLLVTYRREETPGGIPLGSAYRPPFNDNGVTVEVGPLDVTGVQQLTGAILGDRFVAPDFAARLHERTGGIPFVLEETLRALRNSAGVVQTDGLQARRLLDEVEVPALLREACLDRLSRLSNTARSVTRAAAVLGAPASTKLLGELTELSTPDARAALSEALEAGVLLETGESRYGFRHALARQAVYWTLSGPDRERLHARTASELARVEPQPLVRLAEHSRKAGAHDDWLRYAEAASDRAAELGDANTATSTLQELLKEAELAPTDVGRLAVKLSRVAYTGLNQHEVTAALERLLADQRLPDSVRGEVRLALGLLLNRQTGGVESGRAALITAIDELDERPQLRIKAMSVLALPYIGDVSLVEHRSWMSKVDEAVGNTTDAAFRVSMLANNAPAQLMIGVPTAWRVIERLPSGADTHPEQRDLTRAHCNIADSCSWIGYYETARDYLSRGIRLADDCGAPFIVSTARATRAHLDWITGHWQGLAERVRRLRDEYRDLLPVASELSLILGCLAVAGGQWQRAAQYLDDTGMAEPNNAYAPVVVNAHAAKVRMLMAQGEHYRATEVAERGMRLVRRKEAWVWAAELMPAAVAAHLRVGGESDAVELTETFGTAIAELDVPAAAAALPMCYGLLAARRGDDRAEEHFDRARSRAAALPAPYFAALAAERLTRWRLEHARAGCDGADPASTFGELAEEFDALGATHDAARCRYVLREHGLARATRCGRHGYGEKLSPREHEVCRLVADGHRNREIARILFLSSRTVEQHVANVLRKLKLDSREQIRKHTLDG
ncbi:DNA-binding CsgD family transcriptional regulator [Actinopolyspora biskrensis]|uniref:DNA-binding CsgD family transcriptional regulator n=1 Tax=Actinopolyspora biskrensis TaxID=1470178 RepID=A0A852YY74_9ACTN|nr:DNA-binding CsgD family transcriptional regulator [Actinopolyspora biskrensis]